MTDPLALDPILPPTERSCLPFNEQARSHDAAAIVAQQALRDSSYAPSKSCTGATSS
jgi:hypothetical protein